MTGTQFVGPYRLLQRVGEGGMGVVHLALDPDARAVAVKVLRPHIAADDQARLRMAREVDTLRRVTHPRVAAVLAADLEAASPYLVTAYVPGVTLDAAVQADGAMAAERVAQLGRGLADALRSVHAVGVVHRDVKPSNVMLLDGEPWLIDFGIAHLVDETRLTATGLIMGTPGFLAPEVSDGQPVTPATDWWGWGATLAYAATGRPPFGAGPASAVLDRVRRGRADLDGVDPRLAGVIASALEVQPSRRAPAAVLVNGLDRLRPGAGAGAVTSVLPAAVGRTVAMAPVAGTAVLPAATVPLPPDGATGRPHRTVALPGTPGTAGTPGTPGTSVATSSRPVSLPTLDPSSPAPAAALAALLVTAVCWAAVVPGVVLALSMLAALAARGLDGAVTDLLHRRYLRGPRPRERGWFAVRLPWRVLIAVPGTALTLVLPLLLAASADLVVARALDPTSPHPARSWPLAAAALVGWVGAWWGPGGRRLRRGMRLMTVPVVRRPMLAQTSLAVLTLACAAAVIVAVHSTGVDRWPVGP